MPCVMIIGPSKVGKSTLSVRAAALMGVEYVSLDAAAEVSEPGWFERGEALIARYVADRDHWRVLDVGAGFLNDDSRSAQIFSPHTAQIIAVMADPEVVFAHWNPHHPELDRATFMTFEFREHRQRIYRMARHTLMTTENDIENDCKRLGDLIREVLDEAAASQAGVGWNSPQR